MTTQSDSKSVLCVQLRRIVSFEHVYMCMRLTETENKLTAGP